MDKPPAPKPTISRETLGVMGLYLQRQAEDKLKRDFEQAMKAVKPDLPSAKPPVRPASKP